MDLIEFQLLISEALFNEIKQRAKFENITVSEMIETMCSEYLQHAEIQEDADYQTYYYHPESPNEKDPTKN